MYCKCRQRIGSAENVLPVQRIDSAGSVCSAKNVFIKLSMCFSMQRNISYEQLIDTQEKNSGNAKFAFQIFTKRILQRNISEYY